MSNSNFVKGVCRHCSGHLEFPADAVGETIECPHCRQPTELAVSLPPGRERSGRLWPMIGLVILLAAASLAAALWFAKKEASADSPKAVILPTISSNAPATKPMVQNKGAGHQTTNDFAILPFKLEKTPGSSLVYVTGTIRNLAGRQRFGVKIEFNLFDGKGQNAGTATDYESEIDPHSSWRFQALVMESKAVKAQFSSIQEDK
jgi:hypothetical protein